MNFSFSFGSYYPADSVLHQLDPRLKLLAGFAFLGIALAAGSFYALAAIALFVAVLYGMSRIPARFAFKSLAPLLIIAVVASILNLFMISSGEVLLHVGFITITTDGVYKCLFIASRIILMMMGMSLITLTTTTLDLTQAFERLLMPFARFGFPSHELGMIMGIALRFMPQFAGEFRTIYNAQMSRGAALANSPVKGVRMITSLMVPLFTSVFRHADTLAQAMDARCYHGADGQTRLHPLGFARRDGIAAVTIGALLCVVIAINILVV